MPNTLSKLCIKLHKRTTRYVKEHTVQEVEAHQQIFIMAHGLGSRWLDDKINKCPTVYKQLLPIGENPIIIRTIKQIRRMTAEEIVVFAPHAFRSVIPPNIDMLSIPMRSVDTILTGILFTEFLWKIGADLVFLLGDDIFEYELLSKIINLPIERTTIFGRSGRNNYTGKPTREFYALRIPIKDRARFLHALPEYAFDFYYSKLFQLVDLDNFVDTYYWEGWTGDVDDYSEYELYYPTLVKLALEEDEKYLNE